MRPLLPKRRSAVLMLWLAARYVVVAARCVVVAFAFQTKKPEQASQTNPAIIRVVVINAGGRGGASSR